MNRKYTDEEWRWLEERYPSTPTDDLLAAFEARFGKKVKRSTLLMRMSDKGIRKESNRIDWTPEMTEWFCAYVPGHEEREIKTECERLFGVSLTRPQLKGAKSRLHVKSGTCGGRFTSADGGFKNEAHRRRFLEASKATRFRDGHDRNREREGWVKPIGHERVNDDGYVEVKVSDGRQEKPNCNYVAKHRAVWEEAHGRKLRDGEIVVFADGDKRNFDVGNLVVMTQEQKGYALAARMHKGIRYTDRDTCETLKAMADLSKAIKEAGE